MDSLCNQSVARISMRFVIGPPPDVDDFDPKVSGWHRVHELGPWPLVLLGSILGIPLCASFIFAWSSFVQIPMSLQIDLRNQSPWPIIAGILITVFSLIASIAAVIVVHEFIHALAFPRMGFTRSTIVGVWPSRLLPYAAYVDEVYCIHLLFVLLAPLLLLSVVPVVLCALTGSNIGVFAAVSCFNALLSGGDVVMAATILFQVPLFAKIRNSGWYSWWKPA